MLDPELLKILACPACKGPLAYEPQRSLLGCAACKRDYPIQDDIPILLVEESKPRA